MEQDDEAGLAEDARSDVVNNGHEPAPPCTTPNNTLLTTNNTLPTTNNTLPTTNNTLPTTNNTQPTTNNTLPTTNNTQPTTNNTQPTTNNTQPTTNNTLPTTPPDDPPVRPRSNASDYSKNYKVSKDKPSYLTKLEGEVDGHVSDDVTPTSLNHVSDDVTPTLLNHDSVSDSSIASVDSVDVKINVQNQEVNPLIRTQVSDGSIASMHSVDVKITVRDKVVLRTQELDNTSIESKTSTESDEPEPGAALDTLTQTNSLDLPLVVPESSQSGSDDEGTSESAGSSAAEHDSGLQEYSPAWFSDKKHVFVFSEAGKPIYSRYGKEENIVGLFGVMQALLSCVQDQQDDLQCIRTQDHLFVFRCHPPLVLVAISHRGESEDLLDRQLKYLAKQAVFFLTQSHMARLFKNRHNYDLRRQLTGLPKFFDGIIKFSEEESSFLLDSIRCLAMPQALRNEVVSILMSNRCPELVFAIVIYENQIIAVVRPKQYAISSQDLHLLMNYVRTGSTRGHGEKWAPCCLPDFNDGGYLYIHDSYITDNSNMSLVLITNEREQHITMIECKQSIVEQMTNQKTLEKLEAVINHPFLASDTKIPGLYHFIYKSKSSRQLVAPDPVAPYNTDEERLQLHAKYCHVYEKLHHGDQKLTIYYMTGAGESIVGYSMNNAELYCTFSPFVSRPVALNNIDKLLRWIRREENRFFILGTGVY